MSFGSDVLNEGAFGQLSCVVTEGDQPLSISWTFHGAELGSDLDIVTTPIGRRGSMLLISRVGHKHSGSYTCQATNTAGTHTQTAHLYVNGNTFLPPRRKAQKGTGWILFEIELVEILSLTNFHCENYFLLPLF